MKLSVIIPTYNRNDLLKKCLDALHPEKQGLSVENYETIVTDDSEHNLAKQLIDESYPWVKWVAGPKRGPAANRNSGAQHSTTDWLVFIDDDVVASNDLISNYYSAISNQPITKAFEGAILPDDWSLLKKDLAECPVNTDGNCFWTANVCINKQVFFSIGGFDETFIIAAQEDQDLFLRLKKHTAVSFLKDASVEHPVRFISLAKSISTISKKSKNYIKFVEKHEKNGTTLLKFSISQWKFHATHLAKNLIDLKLKSSIISLCWIVWGVPLNIYFLSKVRSNEVQQS